MRGPGSGDSWGAGLRASELLAAGRPREALRWASRAVASGGGGWAFLLRARVKQALGRPRLAVADVTRAFDRDAECGWIFDLPVEKRFIPQSEPQRRLGALNRGFRDDPGCWAVRAFVGKLQVMGGRGRQGLAHLNWAVRARPSEAYLLAWRAEARRRLGAPRGALADARAALRQDPRHAVALAARAGALRVLGRGEEGFKDAVLAHALGPNYEVPALEAARCRLALGDLAGAATWLERAARRAARYGWRNLFEGNIPADGGWGALPEADREVRLLAWRGEWELSQGHAGSALPLLRRAVSGAKPHPWAHAWLGEALEYSGARTEALASLDRAVRVDGSYARARVSRGRLRLMAGRPREALRDLDAALSREPDWALPRYWKARALESLGRSAAALEELDAALRLDSRFTEALEARDRLRAGGVRREGATAAVLARVRAGDFDGACELMTGGERLGLDAVWRSHPSHDLMYAQAPRGTPPPASTRRAWRDEARRRGSAELWCLSAAGELAAGENAAAESLAGRALRLRPSLVASRLIRGAARLAAGRRAHANEGLDLALGDLSAYLSERPRDARALRLRAELLNDLEDFESSARDLKESLRLEPENDWAKIELADMLTDQGRAAQAWPLIAGLRGAWGREGWYWALRGRALATSGKRAAGLRAMEEAARRSPQAGILAWLGEAYRVNARYREALAALGRAIAADPAFLYSYEWRGRLLLMLGRPRAAMADLEANIKADRRHYFAPAFRGEANFKLGRYREAVEDFERAYPLDPRLTWNPRVREGERPGSREEALRLDLDAAVARRPRDAWALAFRGRCRATMGDAGGAFQDLTLALDLAPLAFAFAWRGYCRMSLGKDAPALEDFRRAGTHRWARAWSGQALLRLGRAREALRAFDSATAAADPHLAVVCDWAAGALESMGRTRAAAVQRRRARRWGRLVQGAEMAEGAGFACARALDPLEELFARLGNVRLVGLLETRLDMTELKRSFAYGVRRHAARYGPAYEEALARAGAGTAAALARRGRAQRMLGRWAPARRDLDAALRRDPSLAEAWAWRWELRASPARGLRISFGDIDKAIGLAPDNAWWRVWRGCGRLAVVREGVAGDVRPALEDFQAALRLDPGCALAWAMSAAAWRALGNRTRQTASLRAAIKAEPRQAWLRRQLAEAHALTGDLHGCLRACSEAIRIEETLGLEVFARVKFGRLARMPRKRLARFFSGRDPTEALRCVDLILQREPRAWWALVMRSDLRRTPPFNDFAAGLADLERAVQIKKDCPWAWAYVSRARLHAGRRDAARRAIDRAVGLDPECGWLRAWRGELKRRMGDPEGALSDLEAAVRLDPDYELAYAWRGGAKRQLGQVESALEDLDLAIRLDPRYAWALHERSLALRALNRVDAALIDLQSAWRLDSKYAWSSGKDREGALALLDAALKSDPSHALAQAWRGETLNRMGRFEEALGSLDAALNLDPGLACARAWRGWSLACLGRRSESLRDLNRALSKEPGNSQAHAWRGRVLLDAGRPRAARRALRRSLAAESKSAWALAWAADAELACGSPAAARRAFERSLELNRSNPEAWAGLAEACGRLGDERRARLGRAEALRLRPDLPASLVSQGRGKLDAARPAEALADFRRAQALAPEDPWPMIGSGVCLQKLGRPLEAAVLLKKARELSPDLFQR